MLWWKDEKSRIRLKKTNYDTFSVFAGRNIINRPWQQLLGDWWSVCVHLQFEGNSLRQLVGQICRGRYSPVSGRYSYDLRLLVTQLFKVRQLQLQLHFSFLFYFSFSFLLYNIQREIIHVFVKQWNSLTHSHSHPVCLCLEERSNSTQNISQKTISSPPLLAPHHESWNRLCCNRPVVSCCFTSEGFIPLKLLHVCETRRTVTRNQGWSPVQSLLQVFFFQLSRSFGFNTEDTSSKLHTWLKTGSTVGSKDIEPQHSERQTESMTYKEMF